MSYANKTALNPHAGKVADCHRDRPLYAKGQCHSCYRTARRRARGITKKAAPAKPAVVLRGEAKSLPFYFYLDPTTYLALKARAEHQGCSMAAVVREGLTCLLSPSD